MQQAQLSVQADCVPDSQNAEGKLTNFEREIPHEHEEDAVRDDDERVLEGVPQSNFWRQLRKVLLVITALWLAMAVMRGLSRPRSKVIYTSRYSEDHKFRPAASPIITEHLKDGRTRIRGAEPTARSVPPPKPKPKTKKRRSTRQRKAKGGQ